jgi:hypothetical protein
MATFGWLAAYSDVALSRFKPRSYAFIRLANRDVVLAAHIVGRVHIGAVQGTGILVVPILRYMKRRLQRTYDLILLTKLAAR